MNVYVESNFVLELGLLQHESRSCREILRLCEEGLIRLILPSYSLIEPYETVARKQKQRLRIKRNLDAELTQIARTQTHPPYTRLNLSSGRDSSELIRLTGSSSGAVQRELKRLVSSGLVTVKRIGRHKHYQRNPDCPVFDEICAMVRKTVAMAEPFRQALAPSSRELRSP